MIRRVNTEYPSRLLFDCDHQAAPCQRPSSKRVGFEEVVRSPSEHMAADTDASTKTPDVLRLGLFHLQPISGKHLDKRNFNTVKDARWVSLPLIRTGGTKRGSQTHAIPRNVEVGGTLKQRKQECASDAECDTVTSAWCSYNVRLSVASEAQLLFPEQPGVSKQVLSGN